MPNEVGQQAPDDSLAKEAAVKIQMLLDIAVDHLAHYRQETGLPSVARDYDIALILALMNRDLRFPEEIDIGDAEAAKSIHGKPGIADTGPKMVLYNGAQIAVMKLFVIIHGRDPSTEELEEIARGYACIARELVDYHTIDAGVPGTEVIRVRMGVSLHLALGHGA